MKQQIVFYQTTIICQSLISRLVTVNNDGSRDTCRPMTEAVDTVNGSRDTRQPMTEAADMVNGSRDTCRPMAKAVDMLN